MHHIDVLVHVPSELIAIGRADIVQFMGPIYLLLPQPRFFLTQQLIYHYQSKIEENVF